MSIARLMQMASADSSRPWDISAAEFTGKPINFFYVESEETNPRDVFFKPDGTKMYVIGTTGDDVNEYDLSTAWDISTASYLQNFSVATEDIGPESIFFKPDGTKMYVLGGIGQDVNEYSLSTAWDVSTASYVQNFSLSAQDISPYGLFFKSDGTKMYVTGAFNQSVYEYDLSTAWDISTASYLQSFGVSAQIFTPYGVFFKPDGTKMYVVDNFVKDVNEYDLSTAWDISTASYLQNFSFPAQQAFARGVFFKPDGTKMYVVDNTKRIVWAYDLSTAWDISSTSWTAPTSDYFSVLAEGGLPNNIFFKPDGTKMYVINVQEVDEYDLSTAWDISTSSYLQNFSVAAQESNPQGIFFKPDGTKMYVIGTAGDDVNEYDLSTAWDISTASYLQNFSVSAQETGPQGIFFKPDGTKMYVIGFVLDAVWAYNL